MPRSGAGSVFLCASRCGHPCAVLCEVVESLEVRVAPRGVCDRGRHQHHHHHRKSWSWSQTSAQCTLLSRVAFHTNATQGQVVGLAVADLWDCRRTSAIPLIAANVVCLSLRDPAPARWKNSISLPLRRPSTAPYQYPKLLKALPPRSEGRRLRRPPMHGRAPITLGRLLPHLPRRTSATD